MQYVRFNRSEVFEAVILIVRRADRRSTRNQIRGPYVLDPFSIRLVDLADS
jgi:hypothetical protein